MTLPSKPLRARSWCKWIAQNKELPLRVWMKYGPKGVGNLPTEPSLTKRTNSTRKVFQGVLCCTRMTAVSLVSFLSPSLSLFMRLFPFRPSG